MASTNQHYIPQNLLRAFGKQGNGKEVQVAVYTREKNFVTSTRGAAAQRYFYSELSSNGERTLDDRITEEYEPRINRILEVLYEQLPGTTADAGQAAELIAHLCARTAQMRESFTHGTSQLLDGALDLFKDPDVRWKLMGFDKPEPSGPALEELNKLFDMMNLKSLGVPRQLFIQRGYEEMKANFKKDPSIIDALLNHAQTLHAGFAETAAAGQKRALAQELAPEKRISALAALSWQIRDCDADLILPDCVAVDGSAIEDCRAFVYRPNEQLTYVVMPISSRRLLIGSKDVVPIISSEIANAMFAKCAWQFFIAHEKAPIYYTLASTVGTATRGWFDAEINEALETQIKPR